MAEVGTALLARCRSFIAKFVAEIEHAPIGTSGAIVALADVIYRVISEAGGDHSLPALATAGIESPTYTTPQLLPLLEFLAAQTLIVFAWQRAILFSSRFSLAVMGIAAAFAVVIFPYASDYNSFYFATRAGITRDTQGSFVITSIINVVLSAAVFFTLCYETFSSIPIAKRKETLVILALMFIAAIFAFSGFGQEFERAIGQVAARLSPTSL